MRSLDNWIASVRDCGVVRVRFDDDALIEGIDLGVFDVEPVDSDENALDIRFAPAFQFLSKPTRRPLGDVASASVASTLPSPAGAQSPISFHEVRND